MQTTTMTTEAALVEDAEELVWANLEIQKAQRQITRGMNELAEGIVSLSLVLLDVRRRRLYRFDPEYPTFEAFVVQRHSISPQTANQYVEALVSLGEAQYRTLINDLGVQRTYALALLQKADPALVAAFQALPADERHAVTVAQLTAVDDAVTEQLRAKVALLEQEITRERSLHQQSLTRLHDAEELHQQVSSDLIEERDAARQALDQEQTQTERLRVLLTQAKQQTATQRALPPPTTTPAVPVVVEDMLMAAPDVVHLVHDVETLIAQLGQLSHYTHVDVPVEHRRALAQALQHLHHVTEELLHGT